MSYLLVATTKCIEGEYEAIVSGHLTREEAEQAMQTEVICWSDEGVRYRIEESGDYDWLNLTNCEYQSLVERVAK